MKTPMITITAFALLAFPLQAVQAQQPDIQRTELVRSDVSGSSKEVVQVRVDLGPDAFAANHRHPGEEVAFVLEGSLEYTLEGRAPVTLTAGQSLFIPSGTPHSARNVGEGRASELATYIVEKGAALVEPVE